MPARTNAPPKPHLAWVLALLLFALTAALFSRTLGNGFVEYDDDVYVYANSRINQGLSFSSLTRAFTQAHASNWHPLTTISHMLDCQLFGLNPAGHHAVNVLLHALAAAGLFLVLQQMTASTWRAAVAAALFGFHPLRAESVAWISERKDVLSAVFFMATLLAYIRYARAPDWRHMLLVSVLFAAGLMAKPMLVTLPIVLLLLDFWPLARFKTTPPAEGGFRPVSFWRAVVEKIPLFALAGLSCLATIAAARRSAGTIDPIPIAERLANAAQSYWIYIYQLFWPEKLAVFYPWPSTPPPTANVLAAAAALLLVTIGVFLLRRRFPYCFTGWLWYIVMLLPVVGIWQIGLQAHADRYTYLPHIGLLITLTWGIFDLLRGLRAAPVALPAACVIIALLAWQTWQQLGFWRDGETLWRHAIAVTNANDVALNNLGLALEHRGELDAALARYREALRVLEQSGQRHHSLSEALIHNNIGNNFARRGQLGEAKTEYRQSISVRPDFPNAHVNLANALFQEREWAAAKAEYDEALRLQPADADAQHRAGIAALRLGQGDEAMAHYKQALAAEPQFSAAELDLGNLVLQQGHVDEAAGHYRRAIEIDEGNMDAHFNLARVYLAQGLPTESIKEYKRVVASTPNDPQVHLSLGNAFAAAGDSRSAATEYEKALQIAPNSVSALNNFAWLLATDTDPTVHDAARAVSLAEKANELAGEPHPLIYHTLAAAYAGLGKREEAINAAERAQQLAEVHGDKKLAETVKQELEKYRRNAQPAQ